MKFFAYVLYNKTVSKIYIGQTNSLKTRLYEHNCKQGRHYTANFLGEWKLIYKEEYQSREEVLKREKQLKSYQGRKFIKELLKSIPL